MDLKNEILFAKFTPQFSPTRVLRYTVTHTVDSESSIVLLPGERDAVEDAW